MSTVKVGEVTYNFNVDWLAALLEEALIQALRGRSCVIIRGLAIDGQKRNDVMVGPSTPVIVTFDSEGILDWSEGQKGEAARKMAEVAIETGYIRIDRIIELDRLENMG